MTIKGAKQTALHPRWARQYTAACVSFRHMYFLFVCLFVCGAKKLLAIGKAISICYTEIRKE